MKNKKQKRSQAKNRFGDAANVRKLWICPICGYQCKDTWSRDKHKLSHMF